MNKAILLFVVMVLPVATIADDSFPAPFGLSWNMSVSDLKSAGFSKVTTTSGFDFYTSVSAPKAWSKAETYMAIVYKGKVVKYTAVSTDFTGDVYGTKGKEAYEQLKAILSKKYGQPDSFERIGMKLYDEADEFYQCLDYSGCGGYFTSFDFAGGVVGLQLKGKSRGVGFLNISYESPMFSEAKAAIERGDELSDSDAL